jgi:hypothetical protein
MLAGLVVAAWLGAAVFLAASVAPAAFAVLPSRTLAGALVGRVLPVLFIAGLAIGLGAALIEGSWRRWAAFVLAGACAIDQFSIGRRIHQLQALPETDARRLAFGRLHALSVAFLGVAMIAALVVIIASWRTYGQYSR